MEKLSPRIITLLEKFNEQNITASEMEELVGWYDSYDLEVRYSQGMVEQELDRIKWEQLAMVNARLDDLDISFSDKVEVRKRSRWPRWAAAASIALFLGIGSYWWVSRDRVDEVGSEALVGDVAPGGDRAILTLSNGKQIILTDAANGDLAMEQRTSIVKSADGQLVYQQHRDGAVNEISYNTMTTPRGGKYTLTLGDGTVVTLDAGSSITYPVQFTGRERMVRMTGQAYFVVAHRDGQPFKVSVAGQVVEDLGTEFNINAYEDEPVVKTTLVEGSARVWKASASALLRPGEQAVTRLSDNNIGVEQANVSVDIAWKEGYFRFKDEPITSIMRQLARWYDIEVSYQGAVSTEEFNGRMSRSKNISQMLKQLEKTQSVHFKIEGRRVTVMK